MRFFPLHFEDSLQLAAGSFNFSRGMYCGTRDGRWGTTRPRESRFRGQGYDKAYPRPLAPSFIHLEATGELTNPALDSDGLSCDLPMLLGRVY